MRNIDPELIKQTLLLQSIEDLLEKVSLAVDNLGNSKSYSTEVEDLAHSVQIGFIRRSVVRFLDIFRFLRAKFDTDNEDVFMHYLPNLRCLFDIYARVIFTFDNSIERSSLVIVAEQIKKPAKIIKTSKNNTGELLRAYSDEVDFYREMFSSQGIDLPDDPVKLSVSFLRDNKLDFPTIENMLSSSRVGKFSPKARRIWTTIADNPYSFYRHFSLYSHGDELNEVHGNEILWIASNLQIMGALIIEAIDSELLKNEFEKELEKIFQDAKEFAPYWVEYWKKRVK